MYRSVVNLAVELCLIIFICCLTGCEEPVVEVDPADVSLIDHYVEELTFTLLDVEPDLLGWVREPYSENFPLQYNAERIALLAGHLEIISRIREQRQKEAFPAEAVISEWQVIVARGSDEWILEGPVVVEALARLEELGDRVEKALEVIIDHDGTLDVEQSERVITLLEELVPAVEEIRAVFYQ